jgi:hypothetical protein
VFIDPDALRGPLAERQDSTQPPASGGIAALLDLFAGAVPSARQYEIQSFGRLLARAPTVFDRDNITTTTRRFAVVGERLGAFAAFLGKPFREYDFYVGVYDALDFFAREACHSTVGVDSLCQRERLGAMVQAKQLALDDGVTEVPRTVLRALYHREWESTDPDTSGSLPPAGSPREVLLLALLKAHLRQDRPFDNHTCRDADMIVTLLCRDGFRRVLRELDTDAVRAAMERVTAPGNLCDATHWRESATRCDLDESFQSLIKDPETFMAERLGLLLHQLWNVEHARKRGKDKNQRHWSGAATMGELVYQSSAGYRHRRGFDLNTSSVPRATGWATQTATALVPNYFSVSLRSRGYEFGYRPTFHLSNVWDLGGTIVPLHVIRGAPDYDTHHWAAGLVLHRKRANPWFTGYEAGIEVFGRWRQGPPGNEDNLLDVPLAGYFLGDKVRLGVRLFPHNHSAVNARSNVAVTLGLADLNGLLYWALRGH